MAHAQASKFSSAHYHPLHPVNSAVWEHITPHIIYKNISKDTSAFCHGDTAQALWIVTHGWVKLTRQTPDGKETIVGLCTAGDFLGEAALFPYANYPYNAEVIAEDAELGYIPASIIRQLIQKDSTLSNGIMAMLNQRASQAQLKLEHMNHLSAAQRIGCFFLRLCHTQAGGERTLKIPVEKHILATYLGMKPETFSRSLQQLKSVGVSVLGANVQINDIEHLRQFVCSSCSDSGSCELQQAD